MKRYCKELHSLVIANVGEFNRRQTELVCTPWELAVWDKGSDDLEDMGIFWGGDSKLVVMPRPPSRPFLEDVKRWLGLTNVQVGCPNGDEPGTCGRMLQDRSFLSETAAVLRNGHPINLVSWGPTPALYRLIEGLRGEGIGLRCVDVPPEEHFWVARYVETKAGFREFAHGLERAGKPVCVPHGFVCSNKELAVEASGHFALRGRGFVFKANAGTAGFGSISYGAEQLERGLEWIRRDASRRMSFDNLWSKGPVVLEELIAGKADQPPEAITADFVISAEGKPEFQGIGTMLIRGRHLYGGVKCGVAAVRPAIAQRTMTMGMAIGQGLSEMGYRGWFDIDCVVGIDDSVYVCEINARRASPSHVFSIAERVAGSDWSQRCGIYANDHLAFQASCGPTYEKVRSVFAAFNAESGHSVYRAVPTIATTSFSGPTPFMGYAVVARTTDEAESLGLKLESELRKAVGMSVTDENGEREERSLPDIHRSRE